jgi:hypothetical protein
MIGLQSVPIQQLMSFSSDPIKKDDHHKFGSNFIRKDDKKESPSPISPSIYISDSPPVSDSTNTPDSMFPYQSPLSQ